MRTSRRVLITAGVVAASFALGTGTAHASPTSSGSWSLPAGTYDQVSFYQRIHDATPKSTWYFANQFNVGGQGGYTGLQPKGPGKTSNSIEVQAIFSVWGGVVDKASKCSGNADGATGSSCSVRIDLQKNDRYELRVTRSGNKWTGAVRNTRTGTSTEIGWWTLKSSTGVKNGNVYWHERYVDGYNCTDIPDYDVTMSKPTANNGKVTGTVTALKEGSPCVGKQNWKSVPNDGGYRVTVS